MKPFAKAVAFFAAGLIVGGTLERLILQPRNAVSLAQRLDTVPARPVSPATISSSSNESTSMLTLAEIETALLRWSAMLDSRQASAKAIELAWAVRDEDIPAALKLANTPALSRTGKKFATVLLERWAQVDRSAALAYVQS